MHHITELLTNPFVIFAIFVLMIHHHLPKKVWKPFAVFFGWLWLPIEKLDKKVFPTHIDEVKEVKKSKFKKVSSIFGQALILFVTFIIYIGDMIFYTPISAWVDSLLKHPNMQKFIVWIEGLPIIPLRFLVGIPFLFMEVFGIIGGFLIATGNPIGFAIYLSKFIWIIPFNMINKIGHDKFDKDPWYQGLKAPIISLINAVKKLEAYHRVHNIFVKMKNFIKDSHYNTAQEVRIRKKVIKKAFKEVLSLKHLGTELMESDEVDLIFFSPEATKKLEELKKNPNNPHLKKWIIDYIKKEIGVEDEKSKTKV